VAGSRDRGNFVAVPTSAHHSPQLARLRTALGPLGDAYYYRAVLYCKDYLPSGELWHDWPGVATFVNWPDDPVELCAAFRSAGVVVGLADELWEWDLYNGWLIRVRRKAAEKKARQRAASEAAARAKRAKRKAAKRLLRSIPARPAPIKSLQKVRMYVEGGRPGSVPGTVPGTRKKGKAL